MILLVTNVRISAKTPSYRFPRDSISLVKHFWICVRPNYENRTSHLLGWVWEPYHSLWVTGAYKDDKAEIDLSLWVFGGDITEMEIEDFPLEIFSFDVGSDDYIWKLSAGQKIKIQLNIISMWLLCMML